MNNDIAKWVIGLALFAGLNQQVVAYNYQSCLGRPVKWSTDEVTMRANTGSFPVGSPQRTALETAVQRINLNPSRFRFKLISETGGVRAGNGQNEVWFAARSQFSDESQLGIALTKTHCFWLHDRIVAEIAEGDVALNVSPSRNQWSLSEQKSTLTSYGGPGTSISQTLVHELGHVAGLRHNNLEYNPMLGYADDLDQPHGRGGQYHLATNSSYARAYLGEDASAGTMFLYGARRPAVRDVGVVHFAWKARGWVNQDNIRKTRLQLAGGGPLSSYQDRGELRYRVQPGQTVLAEFTYENNGSVAESGVVVQFVTSLNDLIHPDDPEIRRTWMDLSPQDVYTRQHEVTIPWDHPPGKYALGVVLDPDNQVSEAAEWNNATYILIDVCSPIFGCTPPPIDFPGF